MMQIAAIVGAIIFLGICLAILRAVMENLAWVRAIKALEMSVHAWAEEVGGKAVNHVGQYSDEPERSPFDRWILNDDDTAYVKSYLNGSYDELDLLEAAEQLTTTRRELPSWKRKITWWRTLLSVLSTVPVWFTLTTTFTAPIADCRTR